MKYEWVSITCKAPSMISKLINLFNLATVNFEGNSATLSIPYQHCVSTFMARKSFFRNLLIKFLLLPQNDDIFLKTVYNNGQGKNFNVYFTILSCKLSLLRNKRFMLDEIVK